MGDSVEERLEWIMKTLNERQDRSKHLYKMYRTVLNEMYERLNRLEEKDERPGSKRPTE